MLQDVTVVHGQKGVSNALSTDLFNRIERYLAEARLNRIQAIDAEITVRRMLDDDRTVTAILEDFEIEDGPNLSEWRVKVRFSDRITVKITHHG